MSKKLIFILIFTVVGLIFLQIPVNNVVGSKVSFTLFDLFAPVAGGFLGPVVGIVSVFLMEITNFFFKGASFEAAPIIRLFPTLFAVYYFSRKDRSNIIIPALAMFAFWAHPEGRQAWFYALFWLIPIAAHFYRDKLFVRSLGSTFTAHAVGGAIWIWVFNLPASVWISLIPIVILERTLFAAGISLSYVLMTNVVAYLEGKNVIPAKLVSLEKKYLFSFNK
jgi:hypothetical protein